MDLSSIFNAYWGFCLTWHRLQPVGFGPCTDKIPQVETYAT